MPAKKSLIIMGCAALSLTAASGGQATTTPTFTSGPAIAARNAIPYPDNSTFVYGYQSGSLKVLGRGLDEGPWVMWGILPGDNHFVINGGYDGDPAAAWIPPNNTRIMNCGHAAASPANIYCGKAIPPFQPSDHYLNEGPVAPVGSKTFAAGTTPVLTPFHSSMGVDGLAMFARGTENQIWSTAFLSASGSWVNWSQIPGPPSDSFISAPGATTFTASGDLFIVCAMLASNSKIACSQQA